MSPKVIRLAHLTLLLSLLHMVFETLVSYHTYGGSEYLLDQDHSFRLRRHLRHHLVFLKGSTIGVLSRNRSLSWETMLGCMRFSSAPLQVCSQLLSQQNCPYTFSNALQGNRITLDWEPLISVITLFYRKGQLVFSNHAECIT